MKTKPDISPHFKGSTQAEQAVCQRLIKLEGTPEAIREFCRCRNQLGDYWYWFLLSTCWVSYTGFSDLNLWKRLFGAERPLKHESLMKPSEVRALAQMPDTLVVYRAHRPKETDWIAYTLDPQIAAERFAVQRGVSEVAVYEVNKSDVCALFLRRGEKEVIVLDKTKARHIKTIPIQFQNLGATRLIYHEAENTLSPDIRHPVQDATGTQKASATTSVLATP